MIAQEEPAIVGYIGIWTAIPDCLIVIILDHIMAQDIATGDDPISNLSLFQRHKRLVSAQMRHCWVQDHGEVKA